MFRIGQGWDFHRFSSEGREIFLGGTAVASERGIEAHSDGDVLLHALMDAILGALGKEDIGCLFPDNDPAYKNICSSQLLNQVLHQMEGEGYEIDNVDITLILEKPKIQLYREDIRKSLGRLLSVNIDCIGLKATTTEKMGAIGRGEGIACSVVVLLQKKRGIASGLKRREKRVSQRLEVFTDGACLGNPGPGGWGVVINGLGEQKTFSGGESHTTNNRMELQAVIRGVEYLEENQVGEADIYTDSTYVKKGITEWIHGWKKNGWKNAKKEPVANQDLWEKLDALRNRLHLRFHWVKGHSGRPENEKCDTLARREAEKYLDSSCRVLDNPDRTLF